MDGCRAPHELLPRVHRIASLLKRWLLGTHQGAVSDQHLDYYLDEFTFRFNRRRSRARGLLFYRLLTQALNVDPAPYRRIVGGKGPRRNNSPFCHAQSRHLRPLLSREFLDVALLRLRIRSIVATESVATARVPLGSYSCAGP